MKLRQKVTITKVISWQFDTAPLRNCCGGGYSKGYKN